MKGTTEFKVDGAQNQPCVLNLEKRMGRREDGEIVRDEKIHSVKVVQGWRVASAC